MVKDGKLCCDFAECQRVIEQVAIERKEKFNIAGDWCETHQRDIVARKVIRAKEMKYRGPGPHIPTPPVLLTLKESRPMAQDPSITTLVKVAKLFGVKPAAVEEYLIDTGLLRVMGHGQGGVIYIRKMDVRHLLILGNRDAPKLHVIPELTRKIFFGHPEMTARLNKGVLD
jgi:hypothetical protein